VALQELIWFVLLALAVVVVLIGSMNYARRPSWRGRAFLVLALTSVPTLVILVIGSLAVLYGWKVLPAVSPMLLLVGALLQIIQASSDADKLSEGSRDALSLSGWTAVLFGAGWAVGDALLSQDWG
jgi:CHASE2 domain-containing sensor protein